MPICKTEERKKKSWSSATSPFEGESREIDTGARCYVLRRDGEIWRTGRYWDDGWGGPFANVLDPVPDIALDENLTHLLNGRVMRSWVGKWGKYRSSKGWERNAIEVFLPGANP